MPSLSQEGQYLAVIYPEGKGGSEPTTHTPPTPQKDRESRHKPLTGPGEWFWTIALSRLNLPPLHNIWKTKHYHVPRNCVVEKEHETQTNTKQKVLEKQKRYINGEKLQYSCRLCSKNKKYIIQRQKNFVVSIYQNTQCFNIIRVYM